MLLSIGLRHSQLSIQVPEDVPLGQTIPGTVDNGHLAAVHRLRPGGEHGGTDSPVLISRIYCFLSMLLAYCMHYRVYFVLESYILIVCSC